MASGVTADEKIAANVKRLREAAGLSVAELADKLGVGPHTVYRYQKEHRFLWTELVDLADSLEVSLLELVGSDMARLIGADDYRMLKREATRDVIHSVMDTLVEMDIETYRVEGKTE